MWSPHQEAVQHRATKLMVGNRVSYKERLNKTSLMWLYSTEKNLFRLHFFYSNACIVIMTSISLISIYTLSDLGVLSNLIGSLSLANEHYSPPTEWIMRKPNKNKMAGVNSRFASVSELIFNGFLLKMLLRSLRVYILKQLFFSISVNSGRIFTSPLRGSVNILPLFTSISKNNC